MDIQAILEVMEQMVQADFLDTLVQSAQAVTLAIVAQSAHLDYLAIAATQGILALEFLVTAAIVDQSAQAVTLVIQDIAVMVLH